MKHCADTRHGTPVLFSYDVFLNTLPDNTRRNNHNLKIQHLLRVFNACACKMVTLTLDDRSDTDIYDIKQSFEALDRQKTGRLKIELAYLLLLGLGYITDYTKKDEFNPTTLEEAAKRIESVEIESQYGVNFISGIKLETLLVVIATHPALSQRNRSKSFATRCFELLDDDQKGYVVAADVERLGRDVGEIERNWYKSQEVNGIKMSTDVGNVMIKTTNKIFAADTARLTDNNKINENQQRLHPSVFENLFAPSFH